VVRIAAKKTDDCVAEKSHPIMVATCSECPGRLRASKKGVQATDGSRLGPTRLPDSSRFPGYSAQKNHRNTAKYTRDPTNNEILKIVVRCKRDTENI